MGILFVQSGFAFGFGTSVTANTPADPTTGNMGIATPTSRGIITGVGDTAGGNIFVKVVGTQDTFGPTTWGDIWYSAVLTNVGVGSLAATASCATTVDQAVAVAEYSGLLASPLDQSSSGTGFSTAALTGSITTTQADELIIGMIGNEGGTRTVVPDATFTERQDGGLCSTELSDKIVSATGTYTYSGTVSGASSVWVACIASFKGIASAPAGPSIRPAIFKKREPLQQRMGPC